jgi:hypothetical protein
MSKKEIILNLAKEIALNAKLDKSPERTEGVKQAAKAIKINIDKQLMPIARYLVTLTDIEEIRNKTLEDIQQLPGCPI